MKRGLDLLHPSVLFGFVWILQFLYNFFWYDSYPISIYSELYLFFYVFCGVFVLSFSKTAFSIFDDGYKHKSYKILPVIFSLINVGVFLSVYRSIPNEGINDFFYQARVQGLAGETIYTDNPLLSQYEALMISFMFIWAGGLSLKKIAIKKDYIYFALFCCSVFAMLSAYGARSAVFYFVLTLLFIFLTVRDVGFKILAKTIFALLLLFLVTSYFMRSCGNEETGFIKNLITHVNIYFFSGFRAFSYYMTDGSPVINAELAFFSAKYQPQQMGFYEVSQDVWTNVYTAFAAYDYHLGSVLGPIYFVIFCSYVSLMYRYRKSHPFFLIAYSFSCSALVLTIFQDYSMTALPFLTRIGLIYFLLLILNAFNRNRRITV